MAKSIWCRKLFESFPGAIEDYHGLLSAWLPRKWLHILLLFLVTVICQFVIEFKCAWCISSHQKWSNWPWLCSSDQRPIAPNGCKGPVHEKRSSFPPASRQHVRSSPRLFSSEGLSWSTTSSICKYAFFKKNLIYVL